jgi:hypothetical protein
MVGAGLCVVSPPFSLVLHRTNETLSTNVRTIPYIFLLRVDVDVEPETRSSSQLGWSGNHTGSVSMLATSMPTTKATGLLFKIYQAKML